MGTQRALSALSVPGDVLAVAPSGRIYRPGLDALRFFAFLAVFTYHALHITQSGYLARLPLIYKLVHATQESMGFGLCLFFFLSAYLITSLLFLEKRRTGAVHLKYFYLRRILRIWPLYFLFLISMFALGLLWRSESVEPLRLLSYLLLAGNWFVLLKGWGAVTILPLWSISVEEQYYAAWPLLVRRLQAGGLRLVCIALCAASLAADWLLAYEGATHQQLWVNSLVQMLFFGAGSLFALRIGFNEQQKSRRRAALYIGGGVAFWYFAEYLGKLTDQSVIRSPATTAPAYTLVAVGCTLILLGFLQIPNEALPPPLLYLGRISYGLYVYHFVVLTLVRMLLQSALHTPGVMVVALCGTTALAAVSYEYFEKPFLRLKERFQLIRTEPV